MMKTDMNKTRDEVMAELSEKVSKVLLYQFVRGNLGEDKDGKAVWTCNLNVIDDTYIYLLSHDIRFGVFHGPTLFQRASGSGFLPAAHKGVIERMFPHVSSASHKIPLNPSISRSVSPRLPGRTTGSTPTTRTSSSTPSANFSRNPRSFSSTATLNSILETNNFGGGDLIIFRELYDNLMIENKRSCL